MATNLVSHRGFIRSRHTRVRWLSGCCGPSGCLLTAVVKKIVSSASHQNIGRPDLTWAAVPLCMDGVEIQKFSRPMWEMSSFLIQCPWGGLTPRRSSFIKDVHNMYFIKRKRVTKMQLQENLWSAEQLEITRATTKEAKTTGTQSATDAQTHDPRGLNLLEKVHKKCTHITERLTTRSQRRKSEDALQNEASKEHYSKLFILWQIFHDKFREHHKRCTICEDLRIFVTDMHIAHSGLNSGPINVTNYCNCCRLKIKIVWHINTFIFLFLIQLAFFIIYHFHSLKW
jgi:hypothetical protein